MYKVTPASFWGGSSTRDHPHPQHQGKEGPLPWRRRGSGLRRASACGWRDGDWLGSPRTRALSDAFLETGFLAQSSHSGLGVRGRALWMMGSGDVASPLRSPGLPAFLTRLHGEGGKAPPPPPPLAAASCFSSSKTLQSHVTCESGLFRLIRALLQSHVPFPSRFNVRIGVWVCGEQNRPRS